jgi:hypothetical protein
MPVLAQGPGSGRDLGPRGGLWLPLGGPDGHGRGRSGVLPPEQQEQETQAEEATYGSHAAPPPFFGPAGVVARSAYIFFSVPSGSQMSNLRRS